MSKIIQNTREEIEWIFYLSLSRYQIIKIYWFSDEESGIRFVFNKVT